MIETNITRDHIGIITLETAACKERNNEGTVQGKAQTHVHAFISFNRTIDIYGKRLNLHIDNKVYQGHYQRVKDKYAVLNYILKNVTQEQLADVYVHPALSYLIAPGPNGLRIHSQTESWH